MGRTLRLLVFAVVLVGPGIANAEPAAAQRTMSNSMQRYFGGELDFATAAIGLGASSGYIGGGLLARGTDMTRAAAVPILAVGAIEVAIGIGLWVRTPSQVNELDALIADDPRRFIDEEGARMEGVVDRFGLLTIAETSLLLAGGVTTALGAHFDEDLSIGAGLGVTMQATVALTIDALAKARAVRYLDAIRAFERVQMAPLVLPGGGGLTFSAALP